MKRPSAYRAIAVILAAFAAVMVLPLAGYSHAQEAEEAEEAEKGPQTRVGIPGIFVRQAATKEGMVVLGYRGANESVGRIWLALDINMTVYQGYNTKFSREDVSLKLPDDTMVPLTNREEYYANRAAINAMNSRLAVQSDNLNYLPATSLATCIIGFFPDPMERTSILTRDQIDLAPSRGCRGRFYFKMEDGVQLGQHFLLVRLVDEDVVIPFKIMTKEETKEAEKKLKQARKEEKQRRKAMKQAKKAEG